MGNTNIKEKGQRLVALCGNTKNKIDDIKNLLYDLSEDERRQLLNYEWVSES